MIGLEVLLTIFLGGLLVLFVVVPAFRPLFGKKWEDKRLEDAKAKHERAQKVLMAAELEAKAVEVELRADEVREHILNEKLK